MNNLQQNMKPVRIENANPQINVNFLINQNPKNHSIPVLNPSINNPAAFSQNTNEEPDIEELQNIDKEETGDEEPDDVEEREYDTGHEYMDLQEELELDEETKPFLKSFKLCIYRIRTDLKTPFLEFLVERTDEIPQYHLPLFTQAQENTDDTKDNTALQNNLLLKIETLLDNTETLETPRFLGFQKQKEIPVAFYDLSAYSLTKASSKDGSIQWVLLNQITEENNFYPETLAFFQENVHIRTLYNISTQEEVPPPVLVYHSFPVANRTDDPHFGFPFVFTEKPIYPIEIPSHPTGGLEPEPKTQEKTEPTQNNLLSYINPLSTTNRSYQFILFPPPLEKTLIILKQEFQDISTELLKKYNDVFLKKVCIRFLKDGIDYWIVNSPVVAFPYLPFQPFQNHHYKKGSQTSKVPFLPEKTTFSSLTTEITQKQPVIKNNKTEPNSFHLNLENLLNPHRKTERANMIKIR